MKCNVPHKVLGIMLLTGGLGLSGVTLAADLAPASAAMLAGNCVGCHGPNGVSQPGFPHHRRHQQRIFR